METGKKYNDQFLDAIEQYKAKQSARDKLVVGVNKPSGRGRSDIPAGSGGPYRNMSIVELNTLAA